MAQFNFQTDIKVEIYTTNDSDAFIIGLSAIGGSDVLNGNGFEYIDVTSSCSEINISNSLSFNGFFGRPEEPSGSVTISGNTYDPRVNKAIRPGLPIKISAKDDAGDWNIIHHGRAASIDSFYNPELKDLPEKNIVRFTLGSPMAIATETTIADETYPNAQYASERMDALVTAGKLNNNYFPDFTIQNTALSIIPDEEMGDRDVIGESFANPFLECFDIIGVAGWLTVDNQTENPNGTLVYKTANKPFPVPSNYYLKLDNVGAEIQINYIDLSKGTDDIINAWNVYPTWDQTDIYTTKNQDSIDLFGEKSIDIGINYNTSYGSAQWWADFQIGYYETNYGIQRDYIKSVSVSPINYDDGKLNEIAFIQPGLRYINLIFVDTNIDINANYLATGVTHTITPNSWNTELQMIGA